jgi:hypothetical protein
MNINNIPIKKEIIFPTFGPTFGPTFEMTNEPTFGPTFEMTNEPTFGPTFEITNEPTFEVIIFPTSNPTSIPTSNPTNIIISFKSNVVSIDNEIYIGISIGLVFFVVVLGILINKFYKKKRKKIKFHNISLINNLDTSAVTDITIHTNEQTV